MAPQAPARNPHESQVENNSKKKSWSQTFMRVYLKNEFKFLHLMVFIYLCSGALIFESLTRCTTNKFNNNDGQLALSSISNNTSAQLNDKTSHLKEIVRNEQHKLRLESVKRMWNITNQLNIFYEANWTKLILAELKVFEQKMLAIKQPEDQQNDENLHLENSNDQYSTTPMKQDLSRVGDQDKEATSTSDSNGDGNENNKNSGANRKSTTATTGKSKDRDKLKNRIKSLRRWFIYSLTTLTSMGKCFIISLLMIINKIQWNPIPSHSKSCSNSCVYSGVLLVFCLWEPEN